jgi:predicted protein tyrosine phosphatase
MGISRSTAAMAILLAQLNPAQTAEAIFDHLLELRPQAWPNSRMISFADELLPRASPLTPGLRRVYARQLAKRPETEHYMRAHGRQKEVEMALAAAG